MKIASFNVNDINKRLPNLLAWLAEAKPDVACPQELKAALEVFPAEVFRTAGYDAVWQGQRSWNGAAILACGAVPVVTRRMLPGDRGDTQSRYIEAAVNGILIGCLYLPNGNPQPGRPRPAHDRWLPPCRARPCRHRRLAGDRAATG